MIIFCLKIKSLVHSRTFSPFLGLQIRTSKQGPQASAGWIKLECISHVVCQPIFLCHHRIKSQRKLSTCYRFQSKGALEPTQPPIWWVPGHSWGGWVVGACH